MNTDKSTDKSERIHRAVRDRYAAIAQGDRAGCEQESRATERVEPTDASSCCSSSATAAAVKAWPDNLRAGYSPDELASLPEGAELGLGCGNPTAIASLSPGDIVVDLGSGAGVDCFLAGQRVGESGRAIGVDMTPEMLARARENARKSGATNVEFRLGEIEHIPVADATADVILSNCVINLAPDKASVFREALRVLKPGGRLAVADLIAKHEIPPEIREDMALHSGCIAGALTAAENERLLREAGFEGVRIMVAGVPVEKTGSSGCSCEGSGEKPSPGSPADWVVSATIEGRRPV